MNEAFLKLLVFALSALVGGPLSLLLPRTLRVLGLEKSNYQGEAICSGGGVLFVLAAVPWFWMQAQQGNLAVAAAAVGFGVLGFLDDRWGTPEFKGLRGHLRALRQGRVTTGFVKAAGGLVLACGLAWMLFRSPRALVAAPLIALSANLLNLLDLRPLRALKGFWLLGLPLLWTGSPVLAQLLGLTIPYARLEARRTLMLGDTGSNALGAALGTAAVLVLPVWAQGLALLALALFHLWAEKHSLTAWIEARSWARRLDRWGWNEQE